jgi:hypothetical protein
VRLIHQAQVVDLFQRSAIGAWNDKLFGRLLDYPAADIGPGETSGKRAHGTLFFPAVSIHVPRFLLTGREQPVCKFLSVPERMNSCVLYPTRKQINSGDITMPTPKEYRSRARECLELTDEANQWYVKAALLQLAAEFQRRAEKLEHSHEGP